MRVLLTVLVVTCVWTPLVVSASGPLLWAQHFSPTQFGQVDSVGINQPSSRVFASLLSLVALEGFDLSSGNSTWGPYESMPGSFDQSVVSRTGSSVCVMGTVQSAAQSHLYLACFSTVSSNPSVLFQRSFPNASSSNLVMSDDGSMIAIGIDALDNVTTSQIWIIDATLGKTLNVFDCTVSGSQSQVVNGLLAIDPSGSVVAYSCFVPGTTVADVLVRDTNAPNSSAPLATLTAMPSVGTGIALSKAGKFLAFGASQMYCYQRQGNTFSLYFVSDPVNPADARLLTQIAFDSNDAAAPMLFAGYVTFNQPTHTQRSFVNAFDLSLPRPSTPSWTFYFANSTSSFQDSIGDLKVCGAGQSRVLAVASWGLGAGSGNASSVDTIHAFDTQGNKILGFQTPGSMFGIDCTVTQGGTVTVVAGGKHEHANIMGSGGDMYALRAHFLLPQVDARSEPSRASLRRKLRK